MNRSVMTIAGLVLALGSPAFAQGTNTTTGSTSIGNAVSAAMPGNGGELKTTLTNAGVMNLNQVNGVAMTAQTSDGLPVILVVGPKDLNSSSSVNVDRTGVINALQKAGLKNVSAADGAKMLTGMVDDRDSDKEAVLAIFGLSLAAKGGGGSLDASSFDKSLREAGVKSENTFGGKLVKATTTDGGTIYMIVGDDDLIAQKTDKPSNFDDKAVRQSFDKGSLRDLKVLDNVHLVQGTMNDHTVFAITGKGLQG